MNAKSNPLTVALVSTNSSVIEAVRKACLDEAGNAVRFTVTEDAERAQQEASDQETACVLLDCSINGWNSPKHLKKLGAKKESAPLLLLGNDNWADAERAMNEANAADVLAPSDLTPGGLRRALRYALARRDSEQQLRRLALFDPVSDLPSQVLFWEILALAVRRARRNRDFFSVLLIDFNWSVLPADVAERAQPVLYRNFAQRIKALMRASDTVATFERSQIVVLAESMPRVEDVQIVAAKILSDINAPVAFEDRYLSVSAAIGIALYPTSGSTAEALIGRASQALTSAMERPTNKFVFV
jgi:diguanylate cyclase (GGDEF)-like protein